MNVKIISNSLKESCGEEKEEWIGESCFDLSDWDQCHDTGVFVSDIGRLAGPDLWDEPDGFLRDSWNCFRSLLYVFRSEAQAG